MQSFPKDEILASIRLDGADPVSFGWMDLVAKQFASHARDDGQFSEKGYQRPDPQNPSVSIQAYATDVLKTFEQYE